MTPDDPMVTACRLIADALNRPHEEIPSDASLHTIPAWDSIGHIRVVLALEMAIGRPLSSQTIATLASAADIAAILAEDTTEGR